MREHVTSALVLGIRPRGADRIADLFTLALGRLEARMVAGRAIVSRFTPHIDPLSVVTVRLVKKSRYTLADALTERRFRTLRIVPHRFSEALAALAALRALVPNEEPDTRLFYEVARALDRGVLTVSRVLALLGYDPRTARCERCRAASVSHFLPREGVFTCLECFARGTDGVVLRAIPFHGP